MDQEHILVHLVQPFHQRQVFGNLESGGNNANKQYTNKNVILANDNIVNIVQLNDYNK